MNLNDKKIALLLSGGVDSSVVLYELVRQGLQPDCFYIKIGPEEKEEWDCSSEEDLEMATAVSHKYGCKLEVIGLSQGVLGPGNALHDGEGACRSDTQPRCHV